MFEDLTNTSKKVDAFYKGIVKQNGKKFINK